MTLPKKLTAHLLEGYFHREENDRCFSIQEFEGPPGLDELIRPGVRVTLAGINAFLMLLVRAGSTPSGDQSFKVRISVHDETGVVLHTFPWKVTPDLNYPLSGFAESVDERIEADSPRLACEAHALLFAKLARFESREDDVNLITTTNPDDLYELLVGEDCLDEYHTRFRSWGVSAKQATDETIEAAAQAAIQVSDESRAALLDFFEKEERIAQENG